MPAPPHDCLPSNDTNLETAAEVLPGQDDLSGPDRPGQSGRPHRVVARLSPVTAFHLRLPGQGPVVCDPL